MITDPNLYADLTAARDRVLRCAVESKEVAEKMAVWTDQTLELRRYLLNRWAEWDKQVSLLSPILERVKAAQERGEF
jgi:hypothetical protein